MSGGIAAWGTYLPYWRLQRSAIAGVLGSGGGQGTRAVASYDEDTTTLGVEAGRRALAVGVGPGAASVQDLFFSTPEPWVSRQDQRDDGARCARTWAQPAAPTTSWGRPRSAVGTLLQALGAAAGRGWRPHHPGRSLRPAHRPGGLGRRA